LHEAAFWGQEEAAQVLIAHHAAVDAAGRDKFTPLHEAARMGTVGVAQVLLAAGANVNAKDDRGRTPLSWAGDYGDGKQMQELLQKHGGLR
jgi:ankyrin repeat protein